MSEQTLDLRRSLQILRRHKAIVSVAAALGLSAGIAFTILRPPMFASEALVVLPPSAAKDIGTQVVIAGSDPVLARAIRRLEAPVSLQSLQSRVQAKSVTPDVISIRAQGKTAAQADQTANAVANTYVAYVSSAKSPGVQVQAGILTPAMNATVRSLPARLFITGGLGLIVGALLGAVVALAISRSDVRLRQRDEIADAIGAPVLASIPVGRPSDASGWTRLFDDYEPGSVHAWRLRNALRSVGLWLPDMSVTELNTRGGSSLTVLSLASDRKALALGPQLAVFASSVGIPSALVIGPQQDTNAVAMLRAACDATALSTRSRNLRITVNDRGDADRLPGAALTIVVAVVDGQTPEVTGMMRTTATVLGVSAGAVTAEQLARVGASAAAAGRDISGVLVADPDPADHSTGHLPQVAKPARRRMPTRTASARLENRR